MTVTVTVSHVRLASASSRIQMNQMNAIPDDCRLPREVPLLSSFQVHVVPLPVNPDKAKEDLRNIDMYLKTLVSDMVSRLSDGCRKALWEYQCSILQPSILMCRLRLSKDQWLLTLASAPP